VSRGHNAAVSILSSPRRRRRLLKVAVVLVPLVPLIYLGVHYSSPGNPGEATGPAVEEPGLAQPKRAPFTKEDQRAVRQVLREFEATAVIRRDVGRSWNLSAPSLREGFTRKQWSRGDLPVVPYPAADRGLGSWSFVQYSYTGTVGLEVFLFPKPGSGWSAMTADVELVKGKDGRWRVDYWMPKRFHGPPAVAAKAKAKAKAKPAQQAAAAKAAGKRHVSTTRKAAPATTQPPKPSRAWWLVPIALLSLIVLAPLGFGLSVWYRNRRAAREYLDEQREA
jgi:hypothetical protein